MPKLPRSPYGPMSGESQLLAWLQQSSKSLDSQISFGKTNVNTSFGAPDHSDLSVWKATGTTPVGPNTEFAITHNLTWVPWFYFYILSKAGSLYQLPNTGTAWTAATPTTQGQIFLKCSVASADYNIIII